jgi:hypothetical protein
MTMQSDQNAHNVADTATTQAIWLGGVLIATAAIALWFFVS